MTETGDFSLINKQKQTACLPEKVNSLQIPKAYLEFINHNAPRQWEWKKRECRMGCGVGKGSEGKGRTATTKSNKRERCASHSPLDEEERDVLGGCETETAEK